MKRKILNILMMIVFAIISIFLFGAVSRYGAEYAITQKSDSYLRLIEARQSPNFGACEIGGHVPRVGFPFTAASQYVCSNQVQLVPTAGQTAGKRCIVSAGYPGTSNLDFL